jgi:hypothetical protein
MDHEKGFVVVIASRSYSFEPSDLNGPLKLFYCVSDLNRLISNEQTRSITAWNNVIIELQAILVHGPLYWREDNLSANANYLTWKCCCLSHLYAFIVVMVNQEEENVKCMSLDFVCFNDTIQCSRFQGDQNSHLLNELKHMTIIYMTSSSYNTIKTLKMRHGT